MPLNQPPGQRVEIAVPLSRQVGLLVRQLRKDRNLSQAEFARLCEVANATITLAEGGKRNISLKLLVRFSAVLGVPPWRLLMPRNGDCRWCHGAPPAGWECIECGAQTPRVEPPT
jgi:transcriptional regulator with XRE-family HTH domain